MFRTINQILTFGIWAFICVTSAQSFAQQMTPNHVYQVVENIDHSLRALHKAEFDDYQPEKQSAKARQPRHVLQKAREVYLKVQTLRDLNGLDTTPLGALPVRVVTPGDVKDMVDKIAQNLIEVEKIYGVSVDKNAPLHSGKTPSDVYAYLAKISLSIDHLGLPAVVPNDVYRIAQTVRSDLQVIVENEGYFANIPDIQAQGKTPVDAYRASIDLMRLIQKIAQEHNLPVKGGIIVPSLPQAPVKPAHVLSSLSSALADIGAVKFHLGLTNPTELADQPSGKTPSDVYVEIEKSKALLGAMSL